MTLADALKLAQALTGPLSSIVLLIAFVYALWKGKLHWHDEFQREANRADRFEKLAYDSTDLARWASDVFLAAATGRPMPQAYHPPVAAPPTPSVQKAP